MGKVGKFVNPTDQARKEARKKELKKNKKQRMAVRTAVLKSKDPLQLLEEASIIDKQEYDPASQSNLNDKILQEKRNRVLETFDKLVLMYKKEDAEYSSKLEVAKTDYEGRREKMILYYEQVKLTEKVKASEIPLPQAQHKKEETGFVAKDGSIIHKGIIKKIGAGTKPNIGNKKPPGPPSGPPPPLSDSENEDKSPKKIRFSDSLQMNQQQMSAFPPQPPPIPSVSVNQIPLPNNFMSQLGQGPISKQAVVSAPPTIAPFNRMAFLEEQARNAGTTAHGSQQASTIEAKPQLKNLIGDTTRFVPTSLKVRRTVKDEKGRIQVFGGSTTHTEDSNQHNYTSNFGIPSTGSRMTNKDDAYEQFMKEMENLI